MDALAHGKVNVIIMSYVLETYRTSVIWEKSEFLSVMDKIV